MNLMLFHYTARFIHDNSETDLLYSDHEHYTIRTFENGDKESIEIPKKTR